MNIQELIEWNNKLTKLLNEREQGEGTFSWSIMVGEHLKEFVDKWNDPIVKAYIESEEQRLAFCQNYNCDPDDPWLVLDGDPINIKVREKLERILEE